MAICKPGREPSENQISSYLECRLHTLQNCENINFCCLSHPVHSVLYYDYKRDDGKIWQKLQRWHVNVRSTMMSLYHRMLTTPWKSKYYNKPYIVEIGPERPHGFPKVTRQWQSQGSDPEGPGSSSLPWVRKRMGWRSHVAASESR